MINAKELRSGNLLQGKPFSHPRMGIWSDGITAITAYGIAEIESGNIGKDYEPIPLTPEILERCGFEKHEWFSDRYIWKHGKYLIGLNGWFQKLISDQSAVILNENVTYLHKLQNLFYELEGQELTYTP